MPNKILIPLQSLVSCFLKPSANRWAAVSTVEGLWIKSITKTSVGWKEALPIALLRTHIAPKEQIGLSPCEMLYGRPFVYVNDHFLDPAVQTLQSYTLATGQFQQDIFL